MIILLFIVLVVLLFVCIFFFKQKTAYEMRISDWSSDVCSSDLLPHSGHSPGVRGRLSSSMVLSTSTKGTCATTAPHSSGLLLATAPINSPPAEPPEMLMRPALV